MYIYIYIYIYIYVLSSKLPFFTFFIKNVYINTLYQYIKAQYPVLYIFLLYKRTTVFYCNLRTRGVYASGISSSRYNVKLNFVAVIPLLKELI